jgi:Uma2 family endonuclease
MKVIAAPFSEHQLLVGEIYWRLRSFLEEHPIGLIYIAPRQVKFTNKIKYEPDVLFISNERLNINLRKYVDGAPDFIVEVLSKGTISTDTREKFLVYEQFGVKEYWIINPNDIESSEFYYLDEVKYKLFYPENNVVHSKLLEGFSLDLEKLEEYIKKYRL